MDNPPLQTPAKKFSNFAKIMLIVFLTVGFITSFLAGFVAKTYVNSQNLPSIQPTPKSTANPLNTNGSPHLEFLPGLAYFEDTVIAITKDAPHQTIAATATRLEQKDSKFTQYSRMSYYNGESWNRVSAQDSANSATIVTSNIIKDWNEQIDPSRVLREKITGRLQYKDTSLEFDTGQLSNEISMRSLPGYTKFMSQGEGTLKVDGKSYSAHILYTRIYSLNAEEIQFYDTPFDLTTYWLIFWDENGNFYHIDSTSVPNPTQIYQTHQIAIKETPEGSVLKTFQVNSSAGTDSLPKTYAFNLASPIDERININLLNSINKASDNSYKWYMGQVEGTAGGVKGFGLVEYIHN